MRSKDKNIVLAGLVICILIAVLAPFIASSNPDGLEKTAQDVSNAKDSGIYEAPMPDYTLPFLGEDNHYGGIIALIVGVLVTLTFAYIAAFAMQERKPPEA